MTAAMAGMSAQGSGRSAKPATALAPNARSAARFPAGLIAPRLRQAAICAPNRSCPTSQRSSLGLDRAKQKAARMTKGTVGSNGTNAPMAPIISDSSPQIRNPSLITASCQKHRLSHSPDAAEAVRDTLAPHKMLTCSEDDPAPVYKKMCF